MISQAVKPNLGYELGFTAGELQTINNNGVQTKVEKCALQILQNCLPYPERTYAPKHSLERMPL